MQEDLCTKPVLATSSNVARHNSLNSAPGSTSPQPAPPAPSSGPPAQPCPAASWPSTWPSRGGKSGRSAPPASAGCSATSPTSFWCGGALAFLSRTAMRKRMGTTSCPTSSDLASINSFRPPASRRQAFWEFALAWIHCPPEPMMRCQLHAPTDGP